MGNWNKPTANAANSKAREKQRAARLSRGIVAGALVVLGGGLAAFFVLRPAPVQEDSAPSERSGRIKEVKPAKAATNRSVKAEGDVAANDDSESVKTNAGRRVRYETLPNGAVLRIEPDGSKSLYRKRIGPDPNAGRLFKNNFEQKLSYYTVPGEEYVQQGIDDWSMEDAKNAMILKVEFSDDDTPMDRFRKEGVIQLKEDLREYLKNGGTVQDFIDMLHKRQNREAMLMGEARKVVQDSIKEGSREETQELVDALNKKLAAEGLPPVKMPRERKRR